MKRYFLLLLFPLALLGQVADELDYIPKTYELYDSYTLNFAGTETTGSQLISNGDIETVTSAGPPADFAAWAETSAGGNIEDETVNVHGGGHAVKITRTTGSTFITQSVTTIASSRYQLTFWTRGDGTNPGRYRVYDISNLAEIIATVSTGVAGTSYTKVTVYFNTPAGCVSVGIYAYSPSADGGYAYFDDISVLQAVPYPPAVPGPGKRTVVDTESKLSLEGGKLVFSGGKASPAYGDPGIWWESKYRSPGLTIITRNNKTSGTGPYFGWDTNASGPSYDDVFYGNNTVINNGFSLTVASTTAGQWYYLANTLRSTGSYYFIKGYTDYPNWTLLYCSQRVSTAMLYPTIGNYNAVISLDFLKIPTERLQIRPIAYSIFTGTDGTTLSTTDTTSADGYGISPMAWNNTVWYITNNAATVEPVLGSDIVVNGGFETVTSVGPPANFGTWNESVGDGQIEANTTSPHGGTYDAKLTKGASGNTQIFFSFSPIASTRYKLSFWTKGDGVNAGRYKVESNNGSTWSDLISIRSTEVSAGDYAKATADFVAPSDSLSIAIGLWSPSTVGGIAYFDDVSLQVLTLTNIVNTVSTDQTNVLISCNLTNSAIAQSGVVARWNPTTRSGVAAYHNGTAIRLETLTNGVTLNTLLNVTTTYSAGARIVLVVDGTSASVYYNEALITGSPASITGINGTEHGLYSTSSANRNENFELHYRTHPTWTDYFNKWTKD